jgi:hypothetical protein
MILTNLTTETLAEMAAEKAALVEQHGRKTVQAAIDCGRYLTEIKSRLGHGEWLPWLEENWQYSHFRATQYMRLAGANINSGLYLDDAKDIKDALRILGEAEEAAGTKRTRKPAAATPVSDAEVIDNRPAQPQATLLPGEEVDFSDRRKPGEERVRPLPATDLPPEEPPALPKTNTLHSPATQQRIDRGPDPAPPRPVDPFADLEDGAWYVYYHNNGSPTLTAVTGGDIQRAAAELNTTEPDILEVVVAQHTTPQVLAALTAGYEGDQAKRVAKQLRERADELDPPEETKAPTLPQMRFIIEQRAKLPPTDDRQLKPPVAAAASEWAAHKMSMPKAKRYQSRTSWEACLSRMATLSLDRGADVVCDMIQRAISSGYQGWEFETAAPRGGRQPMRSTNIRTGRNFDAEMGPPIHLSDVEEF